MAQNNDFSGQWKSTFDYVNKLEPEGGVSEYDINIHQNGEELVFESVSDGKGNYFVARLKPVAKGTILIGTWEEDAKPGGQYDRQIYYGAGMLKIEESGDVLSGKIIEYNNDMEIIAGEWKVVRADKK